MPAQAGTTGTSQKRARSSSTTSASLSVTAKSSNTIPPRVLAYTWIANWHDDLTRRTIVRWELTPKSTGTLVKVTHSGLTQLPIARRDYTGGWPGVLDMLKKFAED